MDLLQPPLVHQGWTRPCQSQKHAARPAHCPALQRPRHLRASVVHRHRLLNAPSAATQRTLIARTMVRMMLRLLRVERTTMGQTWTICSRSTIAQTWIKMMMLSTDKMILPPHLQMTVVLVKTSANEPGREPPV